MGYGNISYLISHDINNTKIREEGWERKRKRRRERDTDLIERVKALLHL
jgi:hypothetical protein